MRCPGCAAAIRMTATSCDDCVVPLGAAPLSRANRRHASPEPNSSAALDSQTTEGDLSVLFRDLVGSTRIAANLDVENRH